MPIIIEIIDYNYIYVFLRIIKKQESFVKQMEKSL